MKPDSSETVNCHFNIRKQKQIPSFKNLLVCSILVTSWNVSILERKKKPMKVLNRLFIFSNLLGLPSFRWFQQGSNPYTGAPDWIYKGGYFDRRYSHLPDIYWFGWEDWKSLEIDPFLSFTQSISSLLLKLFSYFSLECEIHMNSFWTKPLHEFYSLLESGNSLWMDLFI